MLPQIIQAEVARQKVKHTKAAAKAILSKMFVVASTVFHPISFDMAFSYGIYITA